ncbi:SOS response-associated peptidase [Rhodoluna sp.]|uniref:SOS response-associated peptidase n=1 Tax=Rhodoluna sp. TaxID=1969481 RepID=UPI0025F58F33|nr:SOS response-associated peptidase [Rhodoluna sp.]
MCGRFVVARTIGEIQTIFEADEIIGEHPGISYNVAPTQPISIVVDRAFDKAADGSPVGELSRQLHVARWGLVPRWAKSPTEHAPLINGRIESILEKPSFKDSVVRRRCVIPASGYYEWHVNADGTKQPYYINAGSDGMFALAGLYEWWANPSKAADAPDRWLLSATTLTKDSAPELAHIHDRNPVLLSPATFEAWLDPHIEGDQDLLDAVAEESNVVASEAEFFKVGADVGAVRNNEPSLIKPL